MMAIPPRSTVFIICPFAHLPICPFAPVFHSPHRDTPARTHSSVDSSQSWLWLESCCAVRHRSCPPQTRERALSEQSHSHLSPPPPRPPPIRTTAAHVCPPSFLLIIQSAFNQNTRAPPFHSIQSIFEIYSSCLFTVRISHPLSSPHSGKRVMSTCADVGEMANFGINNCAG